VSEIKKIGVFTSGGDAPGMNAAIRAVVRCAVHNNVKVAGIRRGYEGMIDGEIQDLTARSVANIIQRGGTMLKSARSKRFRTAEGRQLAFDQLKKHNIDALVAIGGNGTFTGANIFLQEHQIPTIGLPGTIDNDLFGTDFTIGYDTALNTAVEAIDKIRDTAHAHDRIFFIEVMGRDAGYIALNSGLAGGAESILIPEIDDDFQKMVKKLEGALNRGKLFSIIVVAEGDKAGGAFKIAERVNEQFDNIETRVTILGHIQRGGNPSCNDRVLASRLGVAAVNELLAGRKNEMVGIVNGQLSFTSFNDAIKGSQSINKELVDLIDILS